MVIKNNTRDNRRSEVSHKDEIWAQRLGKARNLFSSENKVVEILHEASRLNRERNVGFTPKRIVPTGSTRSKYATGK